MPFEWKTEAMNYFSADWHFQHRSMLEKWDFKPAPLFRVQGAYLHSKMIALPEVKD